MTDSYERGRVWKSERKLVWENTPLRPMWLPSCFLYSIVRQEYEARRKRTKLACTAARFNGMFRFIAEKVDSLEFS
jgi:hypothetical protein